MARPRTQAGGEATADLYIATETFAAEVDGTSIVVHAGITRVPKGHPLMRGRENMFKPAGASPEVEQMTANPGEHRSVTW